MAANTRLLMYSINYSPELTGIGKYNGEMAAWFVDAGFDVDVICAPPYYPDWNVQEGYSGKWFNRKKVDGVTVTRCPLYVPNHPHPKKRILHLASFAISSSLSLLLKVVRKPKVLFVVQPTLFCLPFALLFCKLTGTRSVLHIQDFEVDAMFGLELSHEDKHKHLAKWTYRVESFLLGCFDAVSSISHSMLDKAQQKGVDPSKLIHFPNWSDTDFIHPDVCPNALRKDWNIADDEKVVLYAGNLGAKQGLELVVQAAEAMAHNKKIRFFIVGNGAQENSLKATAEEKNLTNIEFKPLVEWADMPAMLVLADVHIVVQRKGVADAVLPSKLTNILSAGGHALVTAEPHTELGKLSVLHPGIYQCIEPENLDSFVEGLTDQLKLASESKTNTIARKYAEKYLNKTAVLERFQVDLASLIDGKTYQVDSQ